MAQRPSSLGQDIILKQEGTIHWVLVCFSFRKPGIPRSIMDIPIAPITWVLNLRHMVIHELTE